MQTMTVREGRSGRKAKITAKRTYQTASGEWVAEVDGVEFRKVCSDVCKDIKGCTCETLHVQTVLDDDGREYKVVSS